MSRPLRSTTEVGAREVVRRAREANRWIGRQIQEARLDAGVSQGQLARCAGLAPSYVWAIEAGAANPTVHSLTAISACLGCDLGVRLFPNAGPRLVDRFQAPLLEALLRICDASWRGRPEVAVPAARGVIDLVLTRTADRCTVACECHSELRRLELVIRRALEKAEVLGSRFDGGAAPSSLLLLRSTEGTRAIARAYGSTLAGAFPGRAEEAYAALTSPDVPWPGPTLLWARLENGRAEILEVPPRGVRVGR